MVNLGVGSRQYYERYYSSRDWRFYRSILSQIIRHSKPGPILDVGAGVGYLVECAERWGLECKGIEGSADAVAIGQARYPQIKLSQHLLSEPFPFNDESFQTILMNEVIEHLEPEVATNSIREAYRVMQPGGTIFINSPSRYNSYERKTDPTHINMLSPKDLEGLLTSEGFTGVVHMDVPLNILGSNRLAKGLMYALYKLLPWERLSASANCIAYKPDETGSDKL